jgi:hypothetical protein
MSAPTIDDKLYDAEKRKKIQTDIDGNYEDIEPLASGKYSSSLGIEAAQLADGFAYAEYIVTGEKGSFELFNRLAREEYGEGNFRFVQPLPKRFLKDENKSSNALAIYIRFKLLEERKLTLAKLRI